MKIYQKVSALLAFLCKGVKILEKNKNVAKIEAFLIALNNLAAIKAIDKSVVIEYFKQSISKLILEEYDEEANIEYEFNEAQHEFKIINHSKQVVENPKNEIEEEQLKRCIEIPLKLAQEKDKNVQIGDELSEEIDFDDFTKKDYDRILANFKTLLNQYEKNLILEKYNQKVGDIVKAKIVAIQKNGLLFELIDDPNVSGFMPNSSISKKFLNELTPLQVIDVCIEKTLEDSKQAQLLLSNVDDKIIKTLFEREIPEIKNGFIEIVNIARIAGERAKVLIKKSEKAPENMEEVGSIIGRNAERINIISNELKGEKIDVIQYTDDIKDLIINTLSPAKVIDIIQDKTKSPKIVSFTVVVPDPHNTLAIGKKGHNVMLASELTKARLDIISQSQADARNINYNFANGNITLDQIAQLNEGKRLQSNFKRQVRPRNNYQNSFDNQLDLNEFASEIAELRSQVQANSFEEQILGSKNSFDDDIEETLKKVKEEFNSDSNQVKDDAIYSSHITKKDKEDYDKIAKTQMKDFKQDDDLLSDIDLSDISDEDWE